MRCGSKHGTETVVGHINRSCAIVKATRVVPVIMFQCAIYQPHNWLASLKNSTDPRQCILDCICRLLFKH